MTDRNEQGYTLPPLKNTTHIQPTPNITEEAQKVTGERIQFNLNMLQGTTFSDMLGQQLHQQRATLDERRREDIEARDKLIEQIEDVTKAIRSIDRALDELLPIPASYPDPAPTE